MKLKLSAIVLVAILPAHGRAAILTDAEATFLDQLVTAAAVLEQRCTGYEVNGAGGVQYGASILGSPNAAMAMIDAFDAAIKAQNGNDYDASKFRLEVCCRSATRPTTLFGPDNKARLLLAYFLNPISQYEYRMAARAFDI